MAGVIHKEASSTVLKIRDREFNVCDAYIQGEFNDGKLECFIEVDTDGKEFDDELWEPNIRHQGLVLNAQSWEELEGFVLTWKNSKDNSYPHPEIGIVYVFGHAETTDNRLEFGKVRAGKIDIKWSGCNDVSWDDDYGNDVPFSLETSLTIKNV